VPPGRASRRASSRARSVPVHSATQSAPPPRRTRPAEHGPDQAATRELRHLLVVPVPRTHEHGVVGSKPPAHLRLEGVLGEQDHPGAALHGPQGRHHQLPDDPTPDHEHRVVVLRGVAQEGVEGGGHGLHEEGVRVADGARNREDLGPVSHEELPPASARVPASPHQQPGREGPLRGALAQVIIASGAEPAGPDSPGRTGEDGFHHHPLPGLHLPYRGSHLHRGADVLVAWDERERGEGGGIGACVEPEQVKVASADPPQAGTHLDPLRTGQAGFRELPEGERRERTPVGPAGKTFPGPAWAR
jgi:hypothetical protein